MLQPFKPERIPKMFKRILLFIDFERGRTLQLAGQARVIWEKDCAVDFPGAERLVEFRIEQIIEIAGASPFRWRLVERSPFNPA